MDKKNIGKFLKELRTEKGLTQTEFSLLFSKFCGIDAYGGFSCAAISKWERGEALPDLYNLKDIAEYYGVTVDEILEGRRHVDIDYDKLYFGEFESKERMNAADGIKLQIHAEERYRRLLLELANNSISRTDEGEFDYLCLSYFKHYYCYEGGKRTIAAFDARNIKHIKIDIKKIANSLSPCSDEELLFELNRRYCVCNFMPMASISGIGKRFHDVRYSDVDLVGLSEHEPIYFQFAKTLSPWDKDALLTACFYDISRDDDSDDYDGDDVKRFIRSLIDCGATINNAIKYKQVLQYKTRYIAQELALLHQEFCARTAVYDTTQKQYVELEHYSPAFGASVFTPELKKEYAELERRLLAGENEIKQQYSVIRGKSIYDITYREYVQARDEKSTRELYNNPDGLSVEEIKNRYFVDKETAQ